MLERIKESLPPALAEGYTGNAEIVQPRPCRAGVGFALAAVDQDLMNMEGLRTVLKAAKGKDYRDQKVDDSKIEEMIREFSFSDGKNADEVIAQSKQSG